MRTTIVEGEDFGSETKRELREFQERLVMGNRLDKLTLIIVFYVVAIVVLGLAV